MFTEYHQPDMPFGVCSVWHGGRNSERLSPYIICPVRFTQENRIFNDVRAVLKPQTPDNCFLIVQEVSLDLGRLDYVLVDYNESTRQVRDFCILEVMASSTTTTGDAIKSMFDALDIASFSSPYKYGINLRQIVSRMMIQAIAKAYAAETWGKPTVWVVQNTLYEYMAHTTRLNLPDVPLNSLSKMPYSLFFFVYELRATNREGPYQLELKTVKGSDRQTMERVLEPIAIPSLEEIEKIISDKIDSGKFINLDPQHDC